VVMFGAALEVGSSYDATRELILPMCSPPTTCTFSNPRSTHNEEI